MRGVTLIEILLYCAVFTILITGVLTSLHALSISSSLVEQKTTDLQERIFLEDRRDADISPFTP
jgi:Tfp pilus assembly protein PilE